MKERFKDWQKSTKEQERPIDARDIESSDNKEETNQNNPQINEVRTESSLTSGEINTNQVHISVTSLPFVELLIKNFKELNPFAFTYTSMLKPTLM